MPKIKEVHFDTWSSLSDYIDCNYTYFKAYIFRGQADAEWKLESTLARALKKIYPSLETDNKYIVDKHLQEFKKNLRGRSKFDLDHISENELWATGQHFGLFTPLLDWSDSPYVALFFSLQGESKSGKRCLWTFYEKYIETINAKYDEKENKLATVRPLSNDNTRLVSQQGLFLKLPIITSLEDIIGQIDSDYNGSQIISRITFPDTIKDECLASLNNMNINTLTLFPDIIGSAVHTNYLLEIEPFLSKGREKIWKEHEIKQVKEFKE